MDTGAGTIPTTSLKLTGCGQWTQQERRDEVNTALIEILRACSSPGRSSTRWTDGALPR